MPIDIYPIVHEQMKESESASCRRRAESNLAGQSRWWSREAYDLSERHTRAFCSQSTPRTDEDKISRGYQNDGLRAILSEINHVEQARMKFPALSASLHELERALCSHDLPRSKEARAQLDARITGSNACVRSDCSDEIARMSREMWRRIMRS